MNRNGATACLRCWSLNTALLEILQTHEEILSSKKEKHWINNETFYGDQRAFWDYSTRVCPTLWHLEESPVKICDIQQVELNRIFLFTFCFPIFNFIKRNNLYNNLKKILDQKNMFPIKIWRRKIKKCNSIKKKKKRNQELSDQTDHMLIDTILILGASAVYNIWCMEFSRLFCRCVSGLFSVTDSLTGVISWWKHQPVWSQCCVSFSISCHLTPWRRCCYFVKEEKGGRTAQYPSSPPSSVVPLLRLD